MTRNDAATNADLLRRAARRGEAARWLHGAGPVRRTHMDRPAARTDRTTDISRLPASTRSREMSWARYALAMMIFNVLGVLVVYALQRLQAVLPLNPQHLASVSADSSFNTAVSFATNTNWQGYGGETTMSYLTQMLGLTVQNFVSAATGIAVLAALIRGFARNGAHSIGNFWVDLTRSTLYILLPLAFVLSPDSCSRKAWYRLSRRIRPRELVQTDRCQRCEAFARDAAEHCRWAGGVADRDQAARHEWWRILQCELLPSVRKSNATVELRRGRCDPVDTRCALLHVRAHGRRYAAGLGNSRGDDDHAGHTDGGLHMGGTVRQPAVRSTRTRHRPRRA